ncbi:hypothetical protein [Thioclava electrotropha]|uniref:Uncharacterized protein n=1 Tax=Thioclava electrotropha TaxID=1549850 RepID=A0ABX6YQV3_9RHOB|nr:hypothetical protein [Thioclava electrotropha]QPZ90053.1 hypothetical protein AKL02_003580 [Thioclava electrotropha]
MEASFAGVYLAYSFIFTWGYDTTFPRNNGDGWHYDGRKSGGRNRPPAWPGTS